MPTYCTECGTRRVDNEAFCTNCATRFDAADVRPDSPDEAPDESSGHGPSWYVGLSITLAVIVIAAVVGGAALLRQRESAAEVSTVPITIFPTLSDDTIDVGTPLPTYSEDSTTFTEEPSYTEEPTLSYSEEPPTTTTAPPPVELGNATVAVAPEAADNPSTRAIVALLTDYFTAINDRNYTTYRQLHTRAVRAKMTLSEFVNGYRSTQDSQVLLREVGTAEDGRLLAVVDFVSTQEPADGPDHQTCTRWSTGKFLEKEGTKLRIGKSLSGHSTHASC